MPCEPVRAIAFYLPQYHPIPENDEWWGKGFTEWMNVTKARPQFPGHYQPHVPADLGFYDLRLPETRQAQADLARRYGIQGFCYYHYWFDGRSILERPFNEVLATGKPDFPFCLCWANENWTRVWDGADREILLEQRYSDQDDIEHFKSLIPAFKDPRYIRINGKPLYLVYRTGLLPDPGRTAQTWRDIASSAGLGDIFLARVESQDVRIDPREIGFDAAVQFAPLIAYPTRRHKFRSPLYAMLAKAGLFPRGFVDNLVLDYTTVRQQMLGRKEPEYTHFKCVSPSWDNTARRKPAWILFNSTPTLYEEWLRIAIDRTMARYRGDERIVFINAWNEWAEGNHLEPDLKWGHAYLEATHRAISSAVPQSSEHAPVNASRHVATPSKTAPLAAHRLKLLYWSICRQIQARLEVFNYLGRRTKG